MSTEEGRAFARSHAMLFMECSAKTKQARAHARSLGRSWSGAIRNTRTPPPPPQGIQQVFDELLQKALDSPSLWDEQGASAGGARGAVPLGDQGNDDEAPPPCAC